MKKTLAIYSSPRYLLLTLLSSIKVTLYFFWLTTKDDLFTFVCPNIAFGTFAALSGSLTVSNSNLPQQFLRHIPWVFLFNWSNLLIFDLANQRLPASVQEDLLNKPWRPIPRGLITSDNVRQIMLVAIPVVFIFNHYVLHVGTECALILILTWLYNDLGGGDQDWISRNVIIATAFWQFNAGSAKVATAGDTASQSCTLSPIGTVWTTIVSAVILTTMHVQDLKDVAGDKVKGRRTAPLVLGDQSSRLTIAFPVIFWSFACTYYWQLGSLGLGPISLGLAVSWRCVTLRGKSADRKTWELWALWTATLYAMPFAYSLRSKAAFA